jgi:transposase InsO family protein
MLPHGPSLDIFSRYVVGWMLASRESEHLAEQLIRETVVKQGVVWDQLTIHSDRGPSMRSQTVSQLLPVSADGGPRAQVLWLAPVRRVAERTLRSFRQSHKLHYLFWLRKL